MLSTTRQSLLIELRESAHPLSGATSDVDTLLELIGDARFVLIGEATHGTAEFYRERARITRALIERRGFRAVAVEADWPDAYRVNRYVHGRGDDPDADAALADFRRFPSWMWRNVEVLDFVRWLRGHNDELLPDRRASFFGLDLYSLFASIDAVIRYLAKVDPEAALAARRRYGCFDRFSRETETYGYTTSYGHSASCEDDVVEQLRALQQQSFEYLRRDGFVAEDEFFFAEQNARVVKNAEQYYRRMYRSGVSSWNLRDTHMADTFGALVRHLERGGAEARIVVWAHNSHLGDARATEMGTRGELNVGQLLRERYPDETVNVGLTAHRGTVTAASEWGGEAERRTVRRAVPDSYEDLFHMTGMPRFTLTLNDGNNAAKGLRDPLLERAIGVLYLPETERLSHYFRASLPEQFDLLLHFDETSALEPLERLSLWERGEPPETYPSAQ